MQHLLIENKLKITPARLAVLEILRRSHQPSDIVYILAELQKKSIYTNKTTIFRMINIFTEKNIVKRVEFGEGKYRYELSSLPHHHHAVCTKCKTVTDINTCNLRKIENYVNEQFAFEVKNHKLEFFGLCNNCH